MSSSRSLHPDEGKQTNTICQRASCWCLIFPATYKRLCFNTADHKTQKSVSRYHVRPSDFLCVDFVSTAVEKQIYCLWCHQGVLEDSAEAFIFGKNVTLLILGLLGFRGSLPSCRRGQWDIQSWCPQSQLQCCCWWALRTSSWCRGSSPPPGETMRTSERRKSSLTQKLLFTEK